MLRKFEGKRTGCSTLSTLLWGSMKVCRGGSFWGVTMHLVQMKPIERVCVDQDRLSSLYAQLGEAGAEDVVCRALEELALRLTRCTEMYNSGQWVELRKNARSLIAIGEQIGMQLLVKVAADVVESAERNDPTALAATLSRLVRVGEKSLTAVWDSHEQMI